MRGGGVDLGRVSFGYMSEYACIDLARMAPDIAFKLVDAGKIGTNLHWTLGLIGGIVT
jgi:hypothetical protein